MPVFRLVVLFLALLLVSGLSALGADRLAIADFSAGLTVAGAPNGWELKEKSGKADFAIVREGTLSALRLRSADTSFSFQKEVKVDLKQYPLLTWTWKVAKLPAGGDFRRSKTDDQAAQLFVVFSKTKAIVYIWDTTAAPGTSGNAAGPFFMKVKAVVVRSGAGDTGKWITETRNVYEDYTKLFGAEPPAAIGVRLQINSQHTGTSAESYFADVAFEKASTTSQTPNTK